MTEQVRSPLVEQVQAVLDDALDWTNPDNDDEVEAFIKDDTAERIVALLTAPTQEATHD